MNERNFIQGIIHDSKVLFFFQLATERGKFPAASEKHGPWGEALQNHSLPEVRAR